ncbi:nibrin isoform X1 [Morone saxatilis]|uniref:nibrin isoform X1 n=1 Tax=Morone saxatilis TaxID=34816 RepID=UPI0015E1EB2D|nr:nibrin isoform X1 [Morone saxatilis]
MWILTPLQPGGETHYLLSSKEYVVGRKNCDILLPNDQSISRAHAHLTAADQTLTLKDTSKYGTFVNNQRLTENSPMNLKSGDNVTFGVFDSKFSVDHQKPVVCSSCLDNDGKTLLSQALLSVGGKLVNTWTKECTHLVMPSAKVTIKTICALLCCRPVVKPEFFSELSEAAQRKSPPPKAESFIPEIDEPSLSKEDVNLGAIPGRKQLFTGKTFIFLNAKQLKRLSAAVSFGGGRSQLLEEGSLPRDLLESLQSCVVDATTGSSQTLLSSSTVEWANSVKNIVQRKGLRVITESEIGLAAIYASCDQYCNPSSLIPTSESEPKVNPRIPSASLSESVAVDETVLPAASQNITAYAVNTEPSQGTELSEVTGVTAVGETPEKKQTSQLRGSKPEAQKTATQCFVADTMRSSFNTVENTDSQRRKPESKMTGAGSSGIWPQPSIPRTNGGTKTFLQNQSPQKPKNSPQASPQKQSTLTSFFKPASRKRPLEDELFAVMSEPKRPVLESPVSIQAPKTSVTSKETFLHSDAVPAATSQTPLGSAADLFVGRSEAQSDRVSHAVQEEPRSRKRKEMEAEIQMDELESIMSEDMDFDEQPSYNQGQQEQLLKPSSAEKNQGVNTVEALSSSKRQRVNLEENGKGPQVGLERDSGSHKSQKSEQHIVSIKTEQVDPFEYGTYLESSKPPKAPSASTSTNIEPFEEDEASFVEDLELLNVDICQPKEEPKTPLKPVTVKQEVQEESKTDEDLPKKVVLVEFRSLTVSAPPKTKPQKMQDISYAKNYKSFRKIGVPGAERSPNIIGGSALLVHNRGKNCDLDEWLKDAAEEERQNRQEETVGDDLFRYNPTKLIKRR